MHTYNSEIKINIVACVQCVHASYFEEVLLHKVTLAYTDLKKGVGVRIREKREAPPYGRLKIPGFSGEIAGTEVWCPFRGGVCQCWFDVPLLIKKTLI